MKAIDLLASQNHPQLIPEFKKSERKLLSILMSVLDIVPAFRGEILKKCGYGSGKTCQYVSFMEPHYDSPNLPNRYPDGLIVCSRGQATWSAFIEAKTENNKIRTEQIQEYADLANQLDIDSVISISNEFAVSSTELPYHLANNKRRKRDIFHLSWPDIRTEIGLFLGSDNGCNSAEQAVLRHALSFMLSDKSGVNTFDAMPPDWSKFVESANTALGFSSNTSGVAEIINGWQQERRDMCAKLNGIIGGGVELRHPAGARATSQDRAKYDKNLLADHYQLKAGYFFKNTKSQLYITSDLRACSHSFGFQFAPPSGKKSKGTISWLTSRLSAFPLDRYKIGITWPGRGDDTFVDLDYLIRFPESIYESQKEAPRSITLISSHRNVRRFKSRKQFIEDLEESAFELISDASHNGLLSD